VAINVLLGVSGSVASYRAADLARNLMRAGADVRVCLTRGAMKFVTPQLFESLTGNPVLTDAFEEPVAGRMAHIDWARWASVVVVAPASANILAKLAHGVADDMLTTIVSATTAPLILAPAMNPQMYASQANVEALNTLVERGAFAVSPATGDVACGEHGQGKMASISTIEERILEVAQLTQSLKGKHVLVTSGPTREPIDSVRYLSNRSSGKMGAAVARASLSMGAEVTVIAGPSSVAYPLAATIHRVTTAREMLESALTQGEGADFIVGVAAVADFRPAEADEFKIRRSEQAPILKLIQNPDVIATLAETFTHARVVGFAAEPSVDFKEVQAKIKRKHLFAIAANDVSNREIGFDADQNELTLGFADGRIVKSGRMSKFRCAMWLLNEVQSKSF
jgi:phosphopantothenoylcysteine decarboxylase/phosphopantothenate--cysteine ligase